MPKKCSVLGCTTNRDYYEPGLRFFRIPCEDEDLQLRWLQLIGRNPDWKIPNFPTICEKHFTPAQMSFGRNLEPNVVPTLNLPDAAKDNPHSNDDLPTKPAVKRAKVQPKKRDSKRRKIREPEVVLVEVQEALIVEACCRLCSLELKVNDGLKITDVRSSQLVWESVWDVCLLQSDSPEINGEKICGDCWSKLQEFNCFVQTCHEQQKRLFQQPPERIDRKDEGSNEQSDSELKDEQVQKEIESVFEEQNSDLPPLEGLSIDEMLEVLDKVVVIAPRRNKHDAVSIDEECWDCGKMFPNRNQRKEHRKTCSAIGTAESLRNRSHTCEICSKPFNSRLGYRTHLQKVHKNDSTQEKNISEELKRLQSKKRLQCPLCPDRFEQLHQLKYHLKTHKMKSLSTTKPRRIKRQDGNNTCYCEVCDKTFTNPSYLSMHMKFHRRERDFKCDQCEKQFFIRNDLKNHKMTVHEDHVFLCGICGKTYGASRSFYRHMQRQHNSDPNQKPYKCSYCTASFYTASDLKYHVTGHTGEKTHCCEICGQAFRFRHLLTHHKKNKHGMQLDGLMLPKVEDSFEEVLDEQILNEDGNVEKLEHLNEVVILEEIA